uniref:Cytochrome c oxidase subunit NDUFA4 n=1 Tax=Cyprinus carpio TaxID=7962 RepID=A0A8C1M1V7_CYPCA
MFILGCHKYTKRVKSVKPLIPLFFFIGGGCTMSLTYLARLALRNPDVCWDRKNNPEPWNKLGPTDQYKVWYIQDLAYSTFKD